MSGNEGAPRRRLGMPGQPRPGEQLETIQLDETPPPGPILLPPREARSAAGAAPRPPARASFAC
jgi:hypothetical protein